jgi:hypothetical protein
MKNLFKQSEKVREAQILHEHVKSSNNKRSRLTYQLKADTAFKFKSICALMGKKMTDVLSDITYDFVKKNEKKIKVC